MLRKLRRFRRNESGLAALEFALIAPLLVTLLLGTIEICDALECHQKVTMLASTGADLVSQATTVTSSDMSNVFAAMNAVIYPYPSSGAKIVITSVISDGNGGGTVDWSRAQNTSALTSGAAVTIPSGLMPKADCPKDACSVILAQVDYGYTSPIGSFIVGTMSMTDSFYARPRRSATVTCSGCTV